MLHVLFLETKKQTSNRSSLCSTKHCIQACTQARLERCARVKYFNLAKSSEMLQRVTEAFNGFEIFNESVTFCNFCNKFSTKTLNQVFFVLLCDFTFSLTLVYCLGLRFLIICFCCDGGGGGGKSPPLNSLWIAGSRCWTVKRRAWVVLRPALVDLPLSFGSLSL